MMVVLFFFKFYRVILRLICLQLVMLRNYEKMVNSNDFKLDKNRIRELIKIYRDGLLYDVLPFWIKHSVDENFGGFMFSLDRDGTVIDTDKGMWQTCRFIWLLAHLYNRVEKKNQWLQLAEHGINFIQKFGFDKDGRMFFQLTREGKPLRKRRYVFTEAFAAIAFAEYARAADDKNAAQKAKDLFDIVVRYFYTPGLIPPKFNNETRPMKSLTVPMIVLATAQVFEDVFEDSLFFEWIYKCIKEIKNNFMKYEQKAVMETVGSNGEILNHFDGRTLNPGHSIECAWFILHEAKRRNQNPDLIKIGTTMLDWMWKRGWDNEYGGIFYFCDVQNLPVQEYWHDMKFWWTHNETIIATLLAYYLTGNEKYAFWHQKIHDWTYGHFPDTEYGEWFGYLHREGRISVPLKGNLWKGPFHIPRMQLYCWKLLEEM